MSAAKQQPTMAWHPETGESKIYNHPSEVPEGWLDTHPDNVPKAPKPAPSPVEDKLPMTRKEIVAALTEGGLQFDPKAPVKVLYAQLTDAVKSALTDAGVSFDDAADTKALLEKLPKPE